MYTVGINDTQLLGSQLEVGTMDLEQESTIFETSHDMCSLQEHHAIITEQTLVNNL